MSIKAVNNEKMKNQKYNTVRRKFWRYQKRWSEPVCRRRTEQFQTSNRKIIERVKIDTGNGMHYWWL